jgi:hypothetical protein
MKHLTDDQYAEWLSGVSTQEALAHLEECPHCHGVATALRADITRYTLARRKQARQARVAHLAKDFVSQKAIASHRLRWAGVAALALLLAAPTAWMMRTAHAPEAPSPQVNVAGASGSSQPSHAMSDDELLEAVNNDLSREVPQALAPVSVITVARNKMAASAIAVNKTSSSQE